MTTLRIVLPATVAILLSACAHQAANPAPAAPATASAVPPAPSAFPSMPSPPPRTATPDFRKDNNLLTRHQHIVEEARKGGHEIAFIGDSITQGWEGAGKAAWQKTWAPRHAINCGIGGDRTQHILARLDHDLLDALAAPNNHIAHIVLLIGTNNSTDDPADSIALGVQAITDKLHAKLPAARITLMAVFPRGHYPNPNRDNMNALNIRLAQLAAMHPDYIRLLDINASYLNPQGETSIDLMPDYLHLTAAGYQVWSDALDSCMK